MNGRILMLLMLAPFSMPAQSTEDSWDALAKLRPGQNIEVVNKRLKSVQGSFTGYSDRVISLRAGRDEISIPRTEVLSVKNRERSRRGRNALLGLAIGAASGLAVGAIRGATYHEAGETPVFVAVWTPIGAGIGAAVGALIPAGEVTVYRATAGKPPGPRDRLP